MCCTEEEGVTAGNAWSHALVCPGDPAGSLKRFPRKAWLPKALVDIPQSSLAILGTTRKPCNDATPRHMGVQHEVILGGVPLAES